MVRWAAIHLVRPSRGREEVLDGWGGPTWEENKFAPNKKSDTSALIDISLRYVFNSVNKSFRNYAKQWFPTDKITGITPSSQYLLTFQFGIFSSGIKSATRTGIKKTTGK